jgi:chemotaxis protein histidine kinase CheA
MNPQETSIKHSALGWVKKSIDDNLSEIRTDLKLYIEEEDEALLGRVKERLGVIQGVLVMIEQYGAAMLTEEMVALVDFITENKQEQREQGLEVMLRAVLQLPDYLEHIQSGHRDIPIAILPLLNDIRAVRNQDLFSEKLLFLPDLSMHEEGAEIQAIDNDSNQGSKLLAKKLRPVYQLALVKVIKEESVEESLKRLEKVCETLEERSVSEQIARIWWIVGALIESVSRQQLELGVSIKNLLGKVDALFRVILIIGERGLLQRQPVELIKNFLYYIAQPECDGPKTQAIKTAYRLEQFLPSESARSEVLDNIAGPNQALLKTVAEAMKVDIEAVKSTLEVYVNGDLSKVDTLKELPQEMHVISDTLAMIGLGSQRQLIEAQIEVVKNIIDGKKPADEEQLLSMAGELLQVEQSLDQMQKRQPLSTAEPRSESDVSRDYELDSVLSAVVTAALDDIQKTKNAILEFIKDSSRSENIDLCVSLMQESRGALELLGEQRAVAVLNGLLTYLKGYDVVEFMESRRLDALSQVVVSLEYYLEALGERRADASGILDFADIQLQQLLSSMPAEASEPVVAQAAVVDEETKPAAQPAIAPVADDSELAEESVPRLRAVAPVEGVVEAGDESAPESIELEADVIPIESQPAAEAAVPAGKSSLKIEPVDDEPEVLKPGSDPDILEIYLEEASEESQNIARLQQDWLLHPEDENALKNIRRAFHTIKGSGRLVGAMKIGEFAWDFEQLLNRLIDKTIPPNPQIIDAVGQAARALPELVVELKTSKPPRAEISYLRGLARALAEFKAEQLMIGHARQQAGEESPHDRITNGDEAEWQAPAASAATQVVPTDKPDDALLEEIEPDTMRVDPAVFEDIRSKAMPDGEQPDGGDDFDFDDTLLAQPPEIPPAGSFNETGETASFSVADFEFDESDTGYTLATDYAQDAEADNEIEIEEIEALELDEGEVAADDEIKIETIGEDFLGDDFGEVAGDEVSIEAAAAEDASALEAVIADADESEDAFPTLEALEPKDDEPAYTPVDEIDASSVIETGQAEVEEIVMHAPEPDVVGMTLEANQLDSTADAPSKQADSPLDARQAETEPVTDSTPATEQETPPDPLAGATRSLVPGEGAEASEPRDQEPPATTGLSFDPELLIIYQQEVEQHLGIVNSALDHAEQIQELIPGEEVYRALHTIHGASRTADIATIGELAGLMEKPLKSAISQRMALDHEIVARYDRRTGGNPASARNSTRPGNQFQGAG